MNQQKGTTYEKYIKIYLQNKNNETWLWDEIPELELRNSGLLGNWNEHRITRKENKINELPDLGTDILLKNNITNKFELIQCKNFESNSNVTFHHLSGFYAMVSHYDIPGTVYYTSKLSPNIKLLKPNDKIKYIKKEMDETIKTNKINQRLIETPYYYQIEAYNKLKDSNRSILNLPCGMGKTLTSVMIGRDYDNIIIISPLLAYAQQNLERFDSELNIEGYKTIKVNSEGTRDENEILDKLSKNKKNILSFTYKSVDVLIKILNKINNYIVILDEFHNLSKNDIFFKENGSENTPLCKLLYSNAKILFMSATPKFFNFEDSDKINEEIFGNNSYSFTLGRGITEKHICDYELYLPDLRTKATISDIIQEVSVDQFDLDLVSKGKFIIRGMLETGTRKCIIYLRNQQEAIQMTDILYKLNEYFYTQIYAQVIISDTKSNERMKILNDFIQFNGLSFICSVDILNECVDIQICDSIFMTYETESRVLIIQRMLRAIRLDPNNIHKIAKIFLWCSEYNQINFFISQLKEFDETFIENKVLIMNVNENQGGILNRELISNKKIYSELDNVIISVKRFGYGIDSWKKNLEELKKYIQDNKKPLAKSLNKDERKNGKWLESQVFDYKHNQNIMKLPEIRKLWEDFVSQNNELFNEPNDIWYSKLDEVKLFIQNNNRLPTQGSSEHEETVKLAKWIVRNNEQIAKNEKSMKNQDIKDTWCEFKSKHDLLFNAKSDEWFDKLNNLKQFIETNRRLPIENKAKETEYRLRIWLKTQEKICKKNTFEVDKKTAFEKFLITNQSLFSNTSNLELWIEKYKQFIEYIELNNSLPREKVSVPENMPFGQERDTQERLKSLGAWKSNCVQDSKVNFSTVISDINPAKLTIVQQEKYNKRLEKFNEDWTKDEKILSKDYSKLSTKKEKTEYEKIKLKREEQLKRFEEERFEANEKFQLWNDAKTRFPHLF